MNDAEPQASAPISPRVIYKYSRSWLWERTKKILNGRVFGGRDAFTSNEYVHDFDYRNGFKPGSPKWKEARSALEDIAERCRADGRALLVAVLPDFSMEFDENYPYAAIHETVGHWCEEFGIQAIDLMLWEPVASLTPPSPS